MYLVFCCLLLVLLWGYPNWVSFGMWLIIMSGRHCRKRVASICLAIMRVWEWYHFRQTDEIGQNDSDLWQLMCNCSPLNQKHTSCGWFPLTVVYVTLKCPRRFQLQHIPAELSLEVSNVLTNHEWRKCFRCQLLMEAFLCFHFFSSLSFVP